MKIKNSEYFSKYTQIAIDIALEAGALLKEGFHQNFSVSKKEGIHNLVTEYDYKSEKIIIDSILNHFPKSNIISEEKGNINGSDHLKWIIDPLDGTVNFAHGIGFFAVSIAVEVKGALFSGVIYDPLKKELFTAEKDKGAFINEYPIQVSKTDRLEDAIIATGFPYNLKDNPDRCIERFSKVIKTGIPIRRLGSSALDLAYVAAGRFDGYFETNLGPWDIAAGSLIVEEAGGKISSYDNKKLTLKKTNNNIIATNANIEKAIKDQVNL